MAKPKVLVVDDSALMRRLIGSVLSDDGFEVITARNGQEGVQLLLQAQPDVVTLDINMPEMDGLTALSLMMAARPTPVVMLSSLTEKGAMATLEALALGAVDFIAKPGGTISLNLDEISVQLRQKVRSALKATPQLAKHAVQVSQTDTEKALPAKSRVAPLRRSAAIPAVSITNALPVVLVGVSTGGPRTLEEILPLLPEGFPAAVLIAQHMPKNFTASFAQRMDRLCALPVCEVDAPMPLQPGHIYVAQGGADMVVSRKLGRLVVMPVPESIEHAWHPSVDRLVHSALQVLPAAQLVGVQLTGMGNDGAQQMALLRQAGGKTIAEDESTAIVFGMPNDLIQRGGASVVLPAHSVAQQLRTWMHC